MGLDTLKDVFLYHYHDATVGPFYSLSSLNDQEAEEILSRLRAEGVTFAAQRAPDYWPVRRALERRIRTLFEEQGGRPIRAHPHYMVLGPCPWLRAWYRDGRVIKLPLASVDPDVVSFTYGDSFPALRVQDGKPYRGRVYRRHDLPSLISTYGWPQQWNATGALGPERYIEAQVWDDVPADELANES